MINSYWASLAIICVSVYAYFKWKFTYWKKKGVPFVEPTFPFGSYQLLRRSYDQHFSEIAKIHYDHFKSLGHKHCGGYLTVRPVYLPIDREIIKLIMSNDSNNFTDRAMYYNEKDDPLSENLVFMKGDKKWKHLRSKMTPAFSSAKLKVMFQVLVPCSDQLVAAIKDLLKTNKAVNITKLADCFGANVMGSCAFGLENESFANDENIFRKYAKKCYTIISLDGLFNYIIAYSSESLGHFLKICLFPKDATNFFIKVFKDTVEFRESTKYSRPDIMQLLINLKNEDPSITMLDITAQSLIFLIAGSEATDGIIEYCLYELAKNPNIQERLRSEIKKCTAENNGVLTYDNLFEMKYLTQVVDETIRKYPSASFTTRKCTNDYKIPNTDVILDKGTGIVIAVRAIHHDPDYFPNPEEFDPERFNEFNKANIQPCTYLPFGLGPRNCIAGRLGMLMVKLGVAAVVQNFKFVLNEESMGTQKYKALQLTLSFLKPVLLNMEEVSQ